jgi:hypothetical protein
MAGGSIRPETKRSRQAPDAAIVERPTAAPLAGRRTLVITNVTKVVVPVDDQQAALDFWTSNVGFGWWALFEDRDGTRYALGQWTDV